jgi:energy-coupling factor transporter ATP-binding protein EcfA2
MRNRADNQAALVRNYAPPEETSMGIQLKVKNFRCLRNVDWSPDGVCVLVGPNGSGKTTLFDALSFLRLTYHSDVNQAMTASGGSYFRNLDAPRDQPVSIGMTQGDTSWDIDVFPAGGPFNLSIGERVIEGTQTILLKRPEDQAITIRGQQMNWGQGPGSTLRAIANMPGPMQYQPKTPFISTLNGLIAYGSYALDQLRAVGSQLSTDMQLSANGLNAFVVLRNWLSKRDHKPAYDFVVKQMANSFPGVADEIDFDFAGQITSLRLVDLRRKESIPVNFAPHGWLAGLLHLMAVAGAAPGSVVMIDEFENSLHPYAIRHLVQAMRDWAAKRQLTVILAGHSLALLDEFREDPSRVFVMELSQSDETKMPLRLTDYRDPEWLKHFSLGELYRHEDFGGPKETSATAVPAMSTP